MLAEKTTSVLSCSLLARRQNLEKAFLENQSISLCTICYTLIIFSFSCLSCTLFFPPYVYASLYFSYLCAFVSPVRSSATSRQQLGLNNCKSSMCPSHSRHHHYSTNNYFLRKWMDKKWVVLLILYYHITAMKYLCVLGEVFACKVYIYIYTYTDTHTHNNNKNLLCAKYHSKQWRYEDTGIKKQTLFHTSKALTPVKKTDTLSNQSIINVTKNNYRVLRDSNSLFMCVIVALIVSRSVPVWPPQGLSVSMEDCWTWNFLED